MIVGAINWKYVEIPFRNRRLLASRAQLLMGTAVAFTALATSGIVLYCNEGFVNRLTPQERLLTTTSQMNQQYTRDLQSVDIPTNLTTLGKPGCRPELLVWGDSHAMAILPAINALCLENRVAAVAATRSSTLPAIGYAHRKQASEGELVAHYNKSVMEYITQRGIRVVVLVAKWSGYEDSECGELNNAVVKTAEARREHGVDVYFMRDVPEFGFNVPNALIHYWDSGVNRSCLGKMVSDHEMISRSEASLVDALRKLGVGILDPIPLLQVRSASVTKIFPGDSGGSYYHDRHHLSTYGAIAIKSLFQPLIDSVVGGAPSRSVVEHVLNRETSETR